LTDDVSENIARSVDFVVFAVFVVVTVCVRRKYTINTMYVFVYAESVQR